MKECYEKKETLKICGLLDKNPDDEYTIYVDNTEYPLVDILEKLKGQTIVLSSESEIN